MDCRFGPITASVTGVPAGALRLSKVAVKVSEAPCAGLGITVD